MTSPHRLHDSRTGAYLCDASVEQARESLDAGPEGHIETTCYRVRPSGRPHTEAGVYDLAGRGNWFADRDAAVEAAESLDETSPIEGGEWIVDDVTVHAYVEEARPVGRPRTRPDSEPIDQQIAVKITASQRARLDRVASERGVTLGDVVRGLINTME